MRMTTGIVRHGIVELDDKDLPDGTPVTVIVREGEETFRTVTRGGSEAARGDRPSGTRRVRGRLGTSAGASPEEVSKPRPLRISRAAGRSITLALDKAFEQITRHGGIGGRALNTRTPGVRRIHLSKVNYYLYYRLSGEVVEVLDLWHTSRGSDPGL